MVSIEVLLHGESISTNYGSLGYCSTLLIRGSQNIIVDTGHVGQRRALQKALNDRNLQPADINIAVMTHAHWDHAQNYDIFPAAEVLIHEWERKYIRNPHPNDWATPLWTNAMIDSLGKVKEVEDGYQLEDGITVMHTPGHSAGTMALIVETEEGPVAITGDGIANAKVMSTKINANVFWNEADSKRSIERISQAAEIIYPGHDRPFKILKNGQIDYLADRKLTFFGIDINDSNINIKSEKIKPFVMPGIESQAIAN